MIAGSIPVNFTWTVSSGVEHRIVDPKVKGSIPLRFAYTPIERKHVDNIVWKKSTRSSPSGDNCVEVGQAPKDDHIYVQDSKARGQRILKFTPAEWAAFVAGVKDNEFNF